MEDLKEKLKLQILRTLNSENYLYEHGRLLMWFMVRVYEEQESGETLEAFQVALMEIGSLWMMERLQAVLEFLEVNEGPFTAIIEEMLVNAQVYEDSWNIIPTKTQGTVEEKLTRRVIELFTSSDFYGFARFQSWACRPETSKLYGEVIKNLNGPWYQESFKTFLRWEEKLNTAYLNAIIQEVYYNEALYALGL